MKHLKTRIVATVLAVSLAMSSGIQALAYTTPDFFDVAKSNWAYTPVMKMADAGVIKGTGDGTTFSPDMKLSAAMFLTLVGRAVYEADVKAAAQTGDEWYSAYVRVAETKGLLTGTEITDANVEGEITRYDMAVVLSRCAIEMKLSPSSGLNKCTDFSIIPTQYADAVSIVYATGLIKGDEKGNFNGTNTMRRDEAAQVMTRLIAASTPDTPPQQGGNTPKPSYNGYDGEVSTDGQWYYWPEFGWVPNGSGSYSEPSKGTNTELSGNKVGTM